MEGKYIDVGPRDLSSNCKFRQRHFRASRFVLNGFRGPRSSQSLIRSELRSMTDEWQFLRPRRERADDSACLA